MTWPWYQMPAIHSVAFRVVRATYSIDANLTGCWLAIARAAVSPTAIWTGVTTAAMLNGTPNPSRV